MVGCERATDLRQHGIAIQDFARRLLDRLGRHGPVQRHQGANGFEQLLGLDRLGEVWTNWETWFVELEETHTSFPALTFFRSPTPDRSWVTMSGVVLDGAALFLSCINTQSDPQAAITIRAGYLSLRHIAEYFAIPNDPSPAPDDPISVTKEEFLAVYELLASEGVPVRSDREKAWRDFAGWRVNYDQTLTQLASLTTAPWQPWVSDRSSTFRRAPVYRRNLNK